MWYQQHRRRIRHIILITAASLVAFYGICVFLSYKAADIFNIVVAERELFPGSVTVERLSASPLGEVSFEGLRWIDEEGDVLADIPIGSFKVRLWDVVARRIGTTTVTDLTIEQGYIHLFFNDKMELQRIKGVTGGDHKSDKKKDLSQITGIKGNRKFNCHVNIIDGKLETESPKRHFIIKHVNLTSHINTGGLSKINLMAGRFTGTAAAKELRLNGTLDFSQPVPVYDMSLLIRDCNPKSLGVGIDINDYASVYADITGDLPHPVIDGTLAMKKLDITALNFTNLKGTFHYENGKLDAQQVTASVFGGTVEASGQFDLDGKSYHADLHGEKLQGSIAAHDILLRCDVALDLHMGEDKKAGTKEVYGSFFSGPGQYHFLPFQKISGSFAQTGKTLDFRDVIISLAMGDVTTDAFSIVDGKVHLGSIYLDAQGRRSRLK